MQGWRRSWASKTPFFYGWIAVSIGSLSMFFTTPGQSDSFSLFMDSFIAEFGWSRTTVSTLYSIATLLSGCCMFFVGRLVDRFGSRTTSLAAAALLGIACLINSFVYTPTMLFLGFFLARFSGKGALELSAHTVAPHWFERKRALAIMLVGLGGTAGGVVFPLLNNFLINSIGWRGAFRALAGGIWMIYIPVAFLLFISRPEDAGLHPDGTSVSSDRPRGGSPRLEEKALTQGQAIRTTAFWILAFCVFQSSMIGTGAILHFISIFREAGFSMTFAARIMSIKPIIGFGTALAMGLILDKVKKTEYVLATACIGQAAAIFMLAVMRGTGMAFVYSVVGGMSSTMVFYCISILNPRLFGRQHIGGILGVITAVNVVGSAIGPVIFGSIYDLIGSYREVLIVSSLLPLLAGILSMFIRKPVTNREC